MSLYCKEGKIQSLARSSLGRVSKSTELGATIIRKMQEALEGAV